MRRAWLAVWIPLVACDQKVLWTPCEQIFSSDSVRVPESFEVLSGIASPEDGGEELPFRLEIRLKRGKAWRFQRGPQSDLAVCLPGPLLAREAEVATSVTFRGQEYAWVHDSLPVVVEDGGAGLDVAAGYSWNWTQVAGPLRDALLEAKGAQNNDLPPNTGGFQFMLSAGSDRQEDRGFLQAYVEGDGGRWENWIVHTLHSTLEFDDP